MLLETRSISKQFGGITAVDSANYQLEEGEVAGIIGPNGAGKSTFFNLLTGLFYPTNGEVLFRDQFITEVPPYERVSTGIARTFQLVSVFNSLKVMDNLVLSLTRFNRKYETRLPFFFTDKYSGKIKEEIHKALERVDLQAKAETKTSDLSYGEKRKLEIAMSLTLEPELLLLDEPLAGLSQKEVGELIDLLKEIKKDLTLVIVEHKISSISNLVERLSVMHKGQFIADGSPDEVLQDKEVRRVYWHEGQEDE